MKAQLSYLRDYITENLWVIPSLRTASANLEFLFANLVEIAV